MLKTAMLLILALLSQLYPQRVMARNQGELNQEVLGDAEIAVSLRKSLKLNPLFESNDTIRFSVKDTEVTLSGTVNTDLEALSAINDAFASGATLVRSRIRVSGSASTDQGDLVIVPKRFWMTARPWNKDRHPGDGTVSGATVSGEEVEPAPVQGDLRGGAMSNERRLEGNAGRRE